MSLFMSQKREGKEITEISKRTQLILEKIRNFGSKSAAELRSTLGDDFLSMSYDEFCSTLDDERIKSLDKFRDESNKIEAFHNEFSALNEKISAYYDNVKPSVFSKKTRANIETFKLALAELEAFAEKYGIPLDED